MISSGSCSRAGTELCRHHLATALLNSIPRLVWMQGGLLELPRLPSYSSLASSLHPLVKSPLSSQPEASPGLRLCGSACQQAADPQIIITIKHCFPNKTISLPLILCQSLFLFTSGHFHPGTALTKGQNSSTAKYTPLFCWWDGNVGINDGGIRILPQPCSVCAENVCFWGCVFFIDCFSLWVRSLKLIMVCKHCAGFLLWNAQLKSTRYGAYVQRWG